MLFIYTAYSMALPLAMQ